MPRVAYVNGTYIPHHQAAVHIEDRGFQFADGIYEVVAVIHGRLADEAGHLDRLERSLKEIGMGMPVPRETLRFLMRELARRNRARNALLYIQVTRGQAKRDFKFPGAEVRQSLVMTVRAFEFDNNPSRKGIRVVTVPDIRWKRRDIKSVALLPQVLAKQAGAEKGAGEAWMVDDSGFVTEGSSSNAWIVTKAGKLVTRNAGHEILKGVTRGAAIKICEDLQVAIEERPFTPAEAYEAVEAFCTSAGALVQPVIEIDGHKIGDGKPGAVTMRIYEEYRAYADGLRGGQLGWKAE